MERYFVFVPWSKNPSVRFVTIDWLENWLDIAWTWKLFFSLLPLSQLPLILLLLLLLLLLLRTGYTNRVTSETVPLTKPIRTLRIPISPSPLIIPAHSHETFHSTTLTWLVLALWCHQTDRLWCAAPCQGTEGRTCILQTGFVTCTRRCPGGTNNKCYQMTTSKHRNTSGDTIIM